MLLVTRQTSKVVLLNKLWFFTLTRKCNFMKADILYTKNTKNTKDSGYFSLVIYISLVIKLRRKEEF